MFEFAETTHAIDAPRTVRIVRAPTTGHLSACILNDAPVCHAVHWCSERTLPHTTRQPCLWCERDIPLKIECYFGIWITQHDVIRILTLTDFAAQPLLMHRESHGNMRGLALDVHRPSGQKHGRILASITGTHALADVAPRPVELKKHLSAVWELNILAVTASACEAPGGENLANLRR